MRLKNYFALVAAASVLLGTTVTSGAQQTPPIAPGTHHTTRMGGMHRQPGHAMTGSGQIIGNKSTKVYHLPGDNGNMPAEKNRVYFKTEREAMAAGYHVAGTKKTLKTNMHHRMPHTMRNTSPKMGGTSTDGGKQPTGTGGHLPK